MELCDVRDISDVTRDSSRSLNVIHETSDLASFLITPNTAMATDPIVFPACPANLPSQDEITAFCRKAGYGKGGISYTDPSGVVLAWVKYGPNVSIDEALTQDWVATYLDIHPDPGVKVPHVFMAFTSPHPAWAIGHILMEYIDAPDCSDTDHEQVARAVRTLISIEAPNHVPGHFGGGAVVHSLFCEWESGIKYRTSKELENHINGILKRSGNAKLVSFENEKLYLCPVDINSGNFKLLNDTIVALDFRATCFLPESFISYVLRAPVHNFTLKVASHINYPKSTNFVAMTAASYFLTVCGRNDIGLPTSIRQRMLG